MDSFGINASQEDVMAVRNGLASVIGYTELHPEQVNQIKDNVSAIAEFRTTLAGFQYVID